MKLKATYLLVLLAIPSFSNAQDTILDYYIDQGLESNLTLKQKQLSYTKSVASLKEAKGMFFPNISLNARYSVATGGRTIDFPLGDILNPVYSTLNDLTSHLPPDEQFPDMRLDNEEFYFYRPIEQETKLSLYQPIFSPQVYYNYKIQQDYLNAGFQDVNIYKRELVAEIKKAYYNYLKTHYVLNLLVQTLDLVAENVRVNESLYNNDKVTIDVVERSSAEYSKVQQQIADAERNNKVAGAYFNFLLNRQLTDVIELWEDPKIEPEQLVMDNMIVCAMANREEFKRIDAYANASENYLKLNKMNKAPSLIAAIDYGIQGENYKIDDRSDFFLGSFVLKWDLFTGSSNNARIQKAKLDIQLLEERHAELEKQINLELIRSYYDLKASEKSIQSARDQRKSTSSAFNLINKKYNQGQATLIQFLDARNSMTKAEENLIITLADYLIKYAEIERVAGLYNIY